MNFEFTLCPSVSASPALGQQTPQLSSGYQGEPNSGPQTFSASASSPTEPSCQPREPCPVPYNVADTTGWRPGSGRWELNGLYGLAGSPPTEQPPVPCVRRIAHLWIVTLSQVLALPSPSPIPTPRGRGFLRRLRFHRRQQKASWRQRGAAGPRTGAWPALRGFGSACICVGSGPGRTAWAMKGASVCTRRAPLTLLLTELGSFPPLSQNTRACVECV